MQQRISRVTAEGGVELAYASAGDGRPLLYVPGWLSHLELSWQQPDERLFYEALAAGCRLVRYDRSGCGLSGPPERPPSLEREFDELSAVAATLGSEPFDLMGVSLGAPVAAAWAAVHPERVRRLVLYGGWAHGLELATPEVRDHVLGLIASHWGLGSDVLTDIFAPDAGAAARAEFGRYQRAASTAETAGALLALSYALDVRAAVRRVQAPTLVVHREHDRAAPVAQAAALAACIPGARFVRLPGRSHLPYVGDVAAVVMPIRRFLGLPAGRRSGSALTPRQTEIAALVSEGLTNRDIAARLGIQERSAEGHVERILVRLGIRSRAQIATWYAEHREKASGEVG